MTRDLQLIAVLALAGCSSVSRSAELVEPGHLQEIVKGPSGAASDLFRGVFYAGSEDGWDYLVLERAFPASRSTFKVRAGRLPMGTSMPLTRDERRCLDVTRLFDEAL